jgi:hypothetical protein
MRERQFYPQAERVSALECLGLLFLLAVAAGVVLGSLAMVTWAVIRLSQWFAR